MTVAIIVLVFALAGIVVYAVRARRARVPVAVIDEARALDAGMIVGDVVVVPSTVADDPGPAATTVSIAEARVVETLLTRRPPVRWPRRFEGDGRPLDDATRLHLLGDLGIVRAPWGVPLLTQAYEEEYEPEHRRAALLALASYRHPDTQPTFEVALHAEDEEEQAIAMAAIAALRIRAALPS